MKLVVKGTSQALKDIKEAHKLLRQLEDIIRKINQIGWFNVEGEIVIDGDNNAEKE